MPMRQLVVIGIVLLATGCGGPQSSPPTPAAESSPAVQLGGPPTDSGTLSADTGEIKPADPALFYKEPAWLLAVRRQELPRAPVLRRRARPHRVVG